MPPIEAALIKPVVDALLGLFKQSEHLQLKRNAEKALREAIRELLLANPDENKAEARIAIAKAAGILSEDILLAEDMLEKHRANKARTRGKTGSGRKRKTPAGKCAGKRKTPGDRDADATESEACGDAEPECGDANRGRPTDTD
ncbi:MAG: hypothetical protein IT473_15385 [Lysobacter sp.]|nr:hypothetical protein [Lysobacter sp.]